MSNQDLIQRAIEAIGEPQGDDWKLDPGLHAAAMSAREETAVLAPILDSSEVRHVASEYQLYDSRALRAQERFRVWAARSQWAVFLTVCVSAGLLILGSLESLIGRHELLDAQRATYLIKGLSVTFMLAGTALAAFAGAALYHIRNGQLLEDWMNNRALAESHRREYHEKVAAGSAPGGSLGPVPLPLVKLEFFRRFQLGSQLQFYENSFRRHSEHAQYNLTLATCAMFGVAVGNSLAGGFGLADTSLTSLALVSVVASAFATKITNDEAIYQDRRSAALYESAREALARLRGLLDQVRERVTSGDPEAFEAFVKAVHEVMAREHVQWLDTTKERGSAVTQLEERLKEAGPKEMARLVNRGAAS